MPENSIRIVARVVASSDSVSQVRTILSDLVEPTRKEAGCISYELLQNQTDHTDFTFVEEWTSDAAIDAHLTTKHIADALTKRELRGEQGQAPSNNCMNWSVVRI